MKKLLLTLTALTLMVSAAGAAVLWDQSTPNADSYFDSESAGMWGTTIVYGASDFEFTTDATIGSVTTFYTDIGPGYWDDGSYTARSIQVAQFGRFAAPAGDHGTEGMQ